MPGAEVELARAAATVPTFSQFAAALAPAPVSPVPEPAPRPGGFPDPITRAIAETKATMWIAREAETIPGVRKAMHVICGTIGTWPLSAWSGTTRLPDSRNPWLHQPDPTQTAQKLITRTIHDGIWWDRSVWHAVPGGYQRVLPDRIACVDDPTDPYDDPTGRTWYINGQLVPPAVWRRDYVVFDWAGLGGLRRWGQPLLDMYMTVMGAAGRYADEPIPAGTLKNSGMDLASDEIDELIDRWILARQARTVAYLNADTSFDVQPYNSRDLQLVELSEAIVKDLARMFGLPAFALNTDSGGSLIYSTVVDNRREISAALDPWSAPVEQTLSLDEYAVSVTTSGVSATRRGRFVPYGTDVRFDRTEYLRDSFQTRIATLAQAVTTADANGTPLMTIGEARALEPMIPSATPTDGST